MDQIREEGLSHHALPLTRSGKNPLIEIRAFWAIYRLFRKIKPDVVHLVTVKPVLYGGIAARLARIPGTVAAISGLGYLFVAQGFAAGIRRALVEMMYGFALRSEKSRVIFQNPCDRDLFVEHGIINAGQAVMIRGSGADLEAFSASTEPEGVPVVVMAARLLVDKGVREFVEAARLLHSRGVVARFVLAGAPDPGNPSSVTEDELKKWSDEEFVELAGHRSDIASLFSASHIVVLPSYYREGLPKVLVEASACGRAVVTTNMPGCRDAIEPERSGLLVPAKNASALADAIQRLIEDKALRLRMGKAGRRLAEREFSIEQVVDKHLEIYGSFG